MALDPSARSILQSVFAMGFLTLVMFFWMSFTRLAAMKRAGLSFSDAQHPEDLRPRLDSAGRKAGDNYNHLLEAPTVFYAVSLAIVLSGAADFAFVVAAWVFVSLRVAHSAVQATVNWVPARLTFYQASWYVLGFLIVRGAMKL
ncbi:MAPEG family protein [Bradyrhizobium sp. 156]|uniref:MAPEG family protein n=1 Tax=Bradyrhizobium sp. 156 TaxID=2782630 RepID=UPI001FFB4AD4|nr:MAPEG family protein [Bradyrhizobium sp. 156]MCK1323588.1 MAPEG family protein [Bradyrhizobium sp. 156]